MQALKTSISILFVLLMSVSLQVSARSLPDFTDLVKEQSPTVVNISTITHSQSASGMPPGYEQMPEIFRHFFQFGPRDGEPRQRDAQSLGSGFIISEDGYILTNNHVIEGADEIIVRLSDRSELEAKLIGADKSSDIALLKVEESGLPTAKLGSSEELEVGEWVLAIGSPFGFDHTVTKGIVSAKGRSLPNENYVPFIQTDVAINPGNSGGPLFDMDGKVIGINSQIYTRSGGFMGVSFAIPIDVAMKVAAQLKDKGYVSRGYLGVRIQEVNKELAEAFGLDKPAGALVVQAYDGEPAAEAGIMAGDVIVEFNDKPIILSSDLPHVVGQVTPGSEATLVINRQGKEKTITVKVGELPTTEQVYAGNQQQAPKLTNPLGVSVKDMTDEQRRNADINKGVIVDQVVPDSIVARKGVRPGDIIAMLNHQWIGSKSDFDQVVSELPSGRNLPMLVIRKGMRRFVWVRID
ncbi:DegQ family serine endoprotease [Litoribrevibacter albus]|uniref:Probable periplasmic serine endoprotease DegP-like n=1 Tax=Litoribrevibacter albus TaxID=1473156 RepID=A0AA37S7S9_9GAMM|nr:DegQ family serine endoprotease [Litoribrevibacter albus]GLQ29807.1 serine peptidase [Litoribrevibacter albus]